MTHWEQKYKIKMKIIREMSKNERDEDVIFIHSNNFKKRSRIVIFVLSRAYFRQTEGSLNPSLNWTALKYQIKLKCDFKT